MKAAPLLPCSAAALVMAFSGSPVSRGETELSTPVVGMYRFNVPAGATAWINAFVTKIEFQGVATSVTAGADLPDGAPATLLTLAGAGWTPNAWGGLFYVEILTGPAAGRVLDIEGNTADTLTLRGVVPAGTPSFCIRKHATLGSLFRNGAGLAANSDTVTLYSDAGAVSAFFNGTDWIDPSPGAVNPVNDRVVYPGHGFVIAAAGEREVTFGGSGVSFVKTGPVRVNLYRSSAFNLVGPLNPLVATSPSDPLFNTLGRLTPGEFGIAGALTPFSDVAYRIETDGTFDVLAVYVSDGFGTLEISDADPSTDFFRAGSAVTITPARDKEAVFPQTFALPD